MMTRRNTAMVVLTAMLGMVGCGDDGTGPDFESSGEAMVEGRVEETTPAPGTASGAAPAPGTAARTVSVVAIGASGEYTTLASADVGAGGNYRVEGVPAGRTNTAVVAYVDGRAAGEVLLHGRIEGGATIRPAPITYETTLETRSYARIVASGRASQISSHEVALLLHARGADVTETLASDTELDAIARASAEAGATLGSVFAQSGVELGAEARAAAVLSATADLVADLLAGLSLEAANEDFIDAAIDAYTGAGASLQSVVMASAAAATTFDAQVRGQTDVRGHLVTQPVLVNLRARQRAAAAVGASAETALAAVVEASVSGTRTALAAVETAAELKATLAARLSTTMDAVAEAAVDRLAADASLTTRVQVRAAADAALAEAVLGARLEGAATASAAAAATAEYRADVRAAVQAMMEAAGDATADVDVFTDLFIAACAGAYIG